MVTGVPRFLRNAQEIAKVIQISDSVQNREDLGTDLNNSSSVTRYLDNRFSWAKLFWLRFDMKVGSDLFQWDMGFE